MPRGIPNKKKEDVAKPIEGDVAAPVEAQKKVEQPKPAPVVPKLEPLGPGQAYFEAPDGTILIGEDTKNEMWYRGLNGGKGGWINRKR